MKKKAIFIIVVLLLSGIIIYKGEKIINNIRKSAIYFKLWKRDVGEYIEEHSNALLYSNRGKKYNIIVNNISFQRSADIKIDGSKLYACLSNYSWNNYDKTIYEYYKTKMAQSFSMKYHKDGHDHNEASFDLWVSVNIYNDFKEADHWYKATFRHLECRQNLPGIEDVAFIPTVKCWKSGVAILYSNVSIGLDINYYAADGLYSYNQNPERVTTYYNQQKEIYLNFIRDFYPYFRQCAEQAKIPVRESSN